MLKNRKQWLAAAFAATTLTIVTVTAGRATPAENAIWANDQVYGTVATDTSFQSPPAHSTDVIFSFDGSGLSGQRSVAEAAPGDRDYNGGRWHVYAVTFTEAGMMLHDADSDGVVDFELTNSEDVLAAAEMGLVTIADTGIFFECPLRPSRR